MTKTELEILRMCRFLAAQHCPDVTQNPKNPNEFTVTSRVMSVPEQVVQDVNEITINFKDKTIYWYSAMESHHNGDLYGSKIGAVSWDQLDQCYPNLESFTRCYAGKIVENKRAEREEDKAFKRVIGGKKL